MKIIKYKDIYLTLNHYKEPLLSIPKSEGVGYYGAVLCSTDGKYIQCHMCGKLYKSLVFHINRKHKITGRQYKTKYGLAYSTALISECQRQEYKQKFIDYIKSLTPEKKKEFIRKRIEDARRGRQRLTSKNLSHPIQLETKNKRGTCPDQLLAKIKEVAKKLGKTPSKVEFINECGTQRFVHLIYKTFGSWSNALKKLGLESSYRKKGNLHKRYTDQEILDSLRSYAEEERVLPTISDSRRGFIPPSDVITNHFGTWEEARELAGVYDFVPKKYRNIL